MKIVFRHICSLLALTISLNLPLTLAAEEEGLAPAFEPGYRPAIETDEAGFWAQVDRFENKVSQSPQRVTDRELTAYIEHLVCELAGDYCSDIRVYILKNPHFNASMYPNGMMNVWTGLLLRIENEDQLVAVLGHEIGHYLRAHQIERWRSMRNSASVAIFFDMVLTAGLATLAVASNSMAFGRDQELEADQFGVNLMSDKHYDPAEAVALWQYVAEEQSKDNSKSKQSIFLRLILSPRKELTL